MAILVTKRNRQIGRFSFDEVFKETHNSKVEITTNPLQYGGSAANHAVILPKTITIRGGITNTANSILSLLNLDDDFDYEADNDLSAEDNASLAKLYSSYSGGAYDGDRCQQAMKYLYELQSLRLPLQVQTGYMLYDNMVLVDISVVNTKETEYAIYFDLTFTEVIINKPEDLSDINPAADSAALATPNQSLGSQLKSIASTADLASIGAAIASLGMAATVL